MFSGVQSSSQGSTSSGSCERCSSFSSGQSFDTPASAAAPPEDYPSKPHHSSDPGWAAIRSLAGGEIGPRDFRLLRRIGSGDIGTVYLCCLRPDGGRERSSTPSMYAMKVFDKVAVERKKKLRRAEMERRILRKLDHPFLPILYAEFDVSPQYSCVVMDYCSNGNLHSLLLRQPGGRFSLSAARFYAAEVLVALEYLHMLGIVYRDLKPENILIRSDGHIMLSDFDLSFHATASPALHHLKPASILSGSCLFRSDKSLHLFVAEPLDSRSNSFVGTHEYVSPEVASGRPHGSAVDWWAYGIFLYELLYGRTPFAGPTNEATLRNILNLPLAFPRRNVVEAGSDAVAAVARDLIAALLVKDPASRLGSRRGAADVKVMSFFKGVNFALLRSYRPPPLPGSRSEVSCWGTPRTAPVDGF